MGAFVCIIVLAYSKRQQSQYWIATLAISLVYYPFALESPHNSGHTCLPFSRKRSYANAFFSLEFRIHIATSRMTVEGRDFYISEYGT